MQNGKNNVKCETTKNERKTFLLTLSTKRSLSREIKRKMKYNRNKANKYKNTDHTRSKIEYGSYRHTNIRS